MSIIPRASAMIMPDMWVVDASDLQPVENEFKYYVFGRNLSLSLAKFTKDENSNKAELRGNVNGELEIMTYSEIGKDILHCFYMYLLEHNESHLDYLERLK